MMQRCPLPFVTIDSTQCVMPCPADKKFARMGSDKGYVCAYVPDPTKSVTLTTLGIVLAPGTREMPVFTMEDLRTLDTQRYSEYSAEKTRFEQALLTLDANIDKNTKLADAFKDLQEAENARDQSPSAYQAARTTYYTLLKGAGWIEEEKKRVAKAEADPEYRRYMAALTDYETRLGEQRKTLDVVNGIKDKVLSLRDDFKYSVNTFSDQLEKVKIQIAMENRTRDKDASEQTKTATWINLGLNVLLVAVLAYAAYFLAKRFLFRRPMAPATVIRVPTYTPSYF